MLSVLFAIFSAFSAGAADACAKVVFAGFKPIKSDSGEKQFYSAATGLTMTRTCLPHDLTYEEAEKKFKTESNVRNTSVDAVYFESNSYGRYRRIYLVAGSPVLQLTFSARRKNRAALDDTQYLIEKQFKKPRFRERR